MNQRIKTLWIGALESGEYNQTVGALRKPDGYCCLGVLCDLYRQETGQGSWEAAENLDGEPIFVIYEQGELLPTGVVGWAGLQKSNPEVDFLGEENTLSAINDDYNLSFYNIANVIRDNL